MVKLIFRISDSETINVNGYAEFINKSDVTEGCFVALDEDVTINGVFYKNGTDIYDNNALYNMWVNENDVIAELIEIKEAINYDYYLAQKENPYL